MSVWKDKSDFMLDVENISEFFISGEHNNPRNKFVYKSKNDKSSSHSPWYEDSDDDEIDYTFGRGRKAGENIRNPGSLPDTHQLRKEIQMQVRSAVGNRFNNDVLETYYNVYRDDEACNDGPSLAPKELSISYAKEQKYGAQSKHSQHSEAITSNENKKSVAEIIEETATHLTTDHLVENSHSINQSITPNHSQEYFPGSYNPKKISFPTKNIRNEYKPRGYQKRRFNSRNNTNQEPRFNYSKTNTSIVNFNTKEDFPPLS